MLRTDVAHLLKAKYGKQNPPKLRAGDTVKVHQRITEGEKQRIQIFEGIVTAVKHGQGLDGSFTVRKIAAGQVGVERVFPLHSPNVVKVERTKTAKVRRANLLYLRGRRGKALRFKSEVAAPFTWEEPAKVDLPVEEDVPVVEDEIVEEVVAEAPTAEEAPTEEVAEEKAA